ncbi:MAG: AAA family ATPase [Candidatus Babeliales bacterium]
MNIIFLYGPPAVGKLTVAKELHQLTGYKILHNHLTVDLVSSIFDFESVPFYHFNKKFRLELIKGAINYGVNGMILTYCYKNNAAQHAFIKSLIRLVKRNNATIHFVALTASPEVLEQRVTEQSRHATTKIKTVQHLRESFKKHDMLSLIPYVESLTIDTTKQSPKLVAEEIIKKLKLIQSRKIQ